MTVPLASTTNGATHDSCASLPTDLHLASGFAACPGSARIAGTACGDPEHAADRPQLQAGSRRNGRPAGTNAASPDRRGRWWRAEPEHLRPGALHVDGA